VKYILWYVSGDGKDSLSSGSYETIEEAEAAIPELTEKYWDSIKDWPDGHWLIEESENDDVETS
jgi:hypothetical protein